jgi:hypothetical protein
MWATYVIDKQKRAGVKEEAVTFERHEAHSFLLAGYWLGFRDGCDEFGGAGERQVCTTHVKQLAELDALDASKAPAEPPTEPKGVA